jgi:hypothetical protein
VSLTDQLDFDREGCDPVSANGAAATVIRQLAAQLEHAGFQARLIRGRDVDAAERARRLDFALVHLASVLSEMEVLGLVNALRHAATAAEDVHVCRFCGAPIEPWSMLTSTAGDEDIDCFPLIQHSWDQYGVTLCKNCHMSIRQAQWQAGAQM